jgi:hypothetical protein
MPYEPVPDLHKPRVVLTPHPLSTNQAANGELSDNVRDQVACTLRDLGFATKGRARTYQKPIHIISTPSRILGGLGSLISLNSLGRTQGALMRILGSI